MNIRYFVYFLNLQVLGIALARFSNSQTLYSKQGRLGFEHSGNEVIFFPNLTSQCVCMSVCLLKWGVGGC